MKIYFINTILKSTPSSLPQTIIFIFHQYIYNPPLINLIPQMQHASFERPRHFTNASPRKYSPNYRPSRSPNSTTNTSVHSQHLWDMMEDFELFPEEIHHLLKNEDRHLSNCKKQIQRQKVRVTQQVESLKIQIMHNLDDMKISIHAELDKVYKFFLDKYAELKGGIMDIKRIKDEIQMDMGRLQTTPTPKHSRGRTNTSNGSQQCASNSNANLMKSFEQGNMEIKKYQMLNYIAELQRERLLPLNQLAQEIVVLTSYNNGYYQHTQFNLILQEIIDDVKENVRKIYQRKYEFIRDPRMLIHKQQQPILQAIYDDQNHNYRDHRKFQPQVVKVDDSPPLQLSTSQQLMTFQWMESLRLSQSHTLKIQGEDIILCALEVAKGMIAVGTREGVINVYDLSNSQIIAVLKGHTASICTLALIKHLGKQFLASGSDHGCSSICLWDTNTWNMSFKIQGHKAAVTAIVDLCDNQSIISGSYDKRLNVYNLLNEGRIEFNLPANKCSVTGIILNYNGRKMVSCGLDSSLNVWQVVKGKSRMVETMFLERIIQNNTMICSLVASAIQQDIIYIGAKDGKVKLINIEKGQAYKTLNCCNHAVIEMVVFERISKPDHPILLCWPCKEECLKIVNTDTGQVDNFTVKGYIEFGCGIGPKAFILRDGRTLAMLSQSENKKQINFFKIDISK